ncbi:MAG: hypothetical protein JWN03_2828 [Nocardia sp.]|nr:hypothetical protein [Nocardia sp.]MCU1642553.1 hypothetical protein [Nocardia sp.]
MWSEIGKTVRQGMGSWASTARMCACVTMFTIAAMALIWLGTR